MREFSRDRVTNSWGNQVNTATSYVLYELSFLPVYLFMHVSKLSEFIQSDVPSNILLLIPNEFGTVFERLET